MWSPFNLFLWFKNVEKLGQKIHPLQGQNIEGIKPKGWLFCSSCPENYGLQPI